MNYEKRLERLEVSAYREEVAAMIAERGLQPLVTVDRAIGEMIAYLTCPADEVHTKFPTMDFTEEQRAHVRQERLARMYQALRER